MFACFCFCLNGASFFHLLGPMPGSNRGKADRGPTGSQKKGRSTGLQPVSTIFFSSWYKFINCFGSPQFSQNNCFRSVQLVVASCPVKVAFVDKFVEVPQAGVEPSIFNHRAGDPVVSGAGARNPSPCAQVGGSRGQWMAVFFFILPLPFGSNLKCGNLDQVIKEVPKIQMEYRERVVEVPQLHLQARHGWCPGPSMENHDAQFRNHEFSVGPEVIQQESELRNGHMLNGQERLVEVGVAPSKAHQDVKKTVLVLQRIPTFLMARVLLLLRNREITRFSVTGQALAGARCQRLRFRRWCGMCQSWKCERWIEWWRLDRFNLSSKDTKLSATRDYHSVV